MLMFFSTVGLAANYTQLMKGGAKVFLFLAIASVYIIIQNGMGVSLATMLGLDPLMGLIAGSITLSGGHGTGAAWSTTFQEVYGFDNVLEIAMASATFGLIIGGIIGSLWLNDSFRKTTSSPSMVLALILMTSFLSSSPTTSMKRTK
ncbi:sodium/glutamate symport protein [Vibrio astriarenae]|nr:sodium/glutamate symport protein [Vibrio sp. C7]